MLAVQKVDDPQSAEEHAEPSPRPSGTAAESTPHEALETAAVVPNISAEYLPRRRPAHRRCCHECCFWWPDRKELLLAIAWLLVHLGLLNATMRDRDVDMQLIAALGVLTAVVALAVVLGVERLLRRHWPACDRAKPTSATRRRRSARRARPLLCPLCCYASCALVIALNACYILYPGSWLRTPSQDPTTPYFGDMPSRWRYFNFTSSYDGAVLQGAHWTYRARAAAADAPAVPLVFLGGMGGSMWYNLREAAAFAWWARAGASMCFRVL